MLLNFVCVCVHSGPTTLPAGHRRAVPVQPGGWDGVGGGVEFLLACICINTQELLAPSGRTRATLGTRTPVSERPASNELKNLFHYNKHASNKRKQSASATQEEKEIEDMEPHIYLLK